MTDILLVNNFPSARVSWLTMLRRSLESNGASVELSSFREASLARFRESDAVVLSGSFAMLSREATVGKFEQELTAVSDCTVPLLGICFGHQLLGSAFGSRVVRGEKPTERYVKARILREDPLFEGLPGEASLFESHYEELKSRPSGFDLLSTSPTSPVNAVKHRKLPLYGVQFHPEKNSRINPDGNRILANFVKMQD